MRQNNLSETGGKTHHDRGMESDLISPLHQKESKDDDQKWPGTKLYPMKSPRNWDLWEATRWCAGPGAEGPQTGKLQKEWPKQMFPHWETEFSPKGSMTDGKKPTDWLNPRNKKAAV